MYKNLGTFWHENDFLPMPFIEDPALITKIAKTSQGSSVLTVCGAMFPYCFPNKEVYAIDIRQAQVDFFAALYNSKDLDQHIEKIWAELDKALPVSERSLIGYGEGDPILEHFNHHYGWLREQQRPRCREIANLDLYNITRERIDADVVFGSTLPIAELGDRENNHVEPRFFKWFGGYAKPGTELIFTGTLGTDWLLPKLCEEFSLLFGRNAFSISSMKDRYYGGRAYLAKIL